MSAEWGRLKALAGGSKITDANKTIASATTTNVPSDTNFFLISGTATITSLVGAPHTRDREITFIGAASAAVVFTNTTGTTTANQMDLGGQNITVSAKDILKLILRKNGVWNLSRIQYNNASTTTIASGTPTMPNTGDVFYVSGSTTIATWTVTTPGKFRRVLLLGTTGTAVTLTNNNAPTAGQMYLGGVDRQLTSGGSIELVVESDGSMRMISITSP